MIIKKRRFYKVILLVLAGIAFFVGLIILTSCASYDLSVYNTYSLNYTALAGGMLKQGEDPTPHTNCSEFVRYGKDAKIVVAVPEEGYYFVSWSDGVTDFARQDKNVISDLDVTAEFARITDPVTVVYSVHGYGWIDGNAEQTIQRGTETQPVTAHPYNSDEGMVFVRWSDGLSDLERQEVCVTESMEVTALFGFTVEYKAVGNGSIVGNSSQVVVYGEDAVTVTAMPKKGYRFVEWSDGIKTATRTDERLSAVIDVYATFEWRETDIFVYNYDYATGNCSEEGIILTRGEVSGETSVVPTRGKYFKFGGWYLDEQLTKLAFDENGNNLLGEEIFDSPSRDLYAKWDVKEEYITTYPILMVYVTAVDGTFDGNNGQPVTVHYRMDVATRRNCIRLTQLFQETLNDLLDGLVEFEIDSYFTTQSLDESSYINEPYSTRLTADQIPELNDSGILDNYRSVLTVYSFGGEKSLYTDWSGIGDNKYGAIPIDVNTKLISFEQHLELGYGGMLSTCVHEFIHTVEFSMTCYEYHRVYNPIVPTQILDKLFLLNEFPVDFYPLNVDDLKYENKEYLAEAWRTGERAGIPYGYWANEICEVTVKAECINGRPDGFGGVGTVDYGGYIDMSPSREIFDWWYARNYANWTQCVPKGSRTTMFRAEAKEGYKFIGWSDGGTDGWRVITDVQGDITLIAYFERLSYKVEYLAGEGGHVEGETVQTVLTGNRSTWVKAVPDDGYRFVGWSDGNQGYFSNGYETRCDIPGSNIRDEDGNLVKRLEITVTAIFEKIKE